MRAARDREVPAVCKACADNWTESTEQPVTELTMAEGEGRCHCHVRYTAQISVNNSPTGKTPTLGDGGAVLGGEENC